MSASGTVSPSSRADAALVLAKALADRFGGDARDYVCTYLGVSGGEHVFRDRRTRVWSVDLVTGLVTLYVGTPPEGWAHPPKMPE